MFQSPPHRGDRCNGDACDERPVDGYRHVSVPSSSGRSVQHRQRRVSPGLCVWFQSPPHRGDRCNLIQFGPARVAEFSFSPLLIGEIGATLRRLGLRHRVEPVVSVPSSSGRSVQHLTVARTSRLTRSFQSPPHCEIVGFCCTEEFIPSQQAELPQIASHLRNSLPYIIAVVAKLATDATCARRRRFRHPFLAHEAPNLVDGRDHLLP